MIIRFTPLADDAICSRVFFILNHAVHLLLFHNSILRSCPTNAIWHRHLAKEMTRQKQAGPSFVTPSSLVRSVSLLHPYQTYLKLTPLRRWTNPSRRQIETKRNAQLESRAFPFSSYHAVIFQHKQRRTQCACLLAEHHCLSYFRPRWRPLYLLSREEMVFNWEE